MIDLLWVIWDGASYDVARRLLDAGELPALARVSGGRIFPVAPLAPNCQTPPSLASLFTGGSIAEHGVSGFRVPAASLVDSRSGFAPSAVRLPLLWDELAAKGMRPGLCHVPWTAEPADEKVVIHAYEHQLAKPDLVELADGAVLDLAGRTVEVRAVTGARFEARCEETGSRIAIDPSAELRFAREPLRLGPGLATRLAVLAMADARFLVHTGLWEVHSRPADLAESLGAFIGKTLGDAYHTGRLGPPGGGAAEDALLRSARLQVECFTASFDALLRSGLPDGLAICYLPTVDELQHELFRWHGEGAGRSEVLRCAYLMADELLARLLTHLGPGTRVVVSSDHGAAVLRRTYHPNETLARAGLLRFDERGGIDAESSRAAYHPAGNGTVRVEGADRPVVDAAEAALRAARDPETGHAPIDVRRVPPGERELLGDLFVSPLTGYECTWRPGPGGVEFADSPKGGTHTAPTGESTLRGMVATAAGGAGEGMTLMDVHALVAGLLSRWTAPGRASRRPA